MAFVPPGPEERRRAIGSLDGVPLHLQRAFTDSGDFEPVPAPARLDWLGIAREKGQTFDRFTRATSSPDAARHRIYLQPLGGPSMQQLDLVRQLEQFATAFFVRDVRALPPLDVESIVRSRRNRFTGVLQLHTRDLLARLSIQVPPDARCLLGISAYDLYAHDRWSFVFGEAKVDDHVGVISFVRYDPRFYERPADATTLLRRACKVLAHETCHMLGMMHCIFFNCLMNGSNHLAESDRRPLHLCPVDLRKLHWSLGCDLIDRYRRLAQFWREAGVPAEAEWLERRREFIQYGAPTPT